MSSRRVIIAGGGAAGFFAAITCAETMPAADVLILEKSSHFLSKVRISGGGRCNVTHACFEPRELAARFPRGQRALIAPFQRFQPNDTVAWFEDRGVKLKVESDGRVFPTTDSSQTIIDCLLSAAKRAGVKMMSNAGVERAVANEGGRSSCRSRRARKRFAIACFWPRAVVARPRWVNWRFRSVTLLSRPCRRCLLF